ncbi:MAG: sigma-70 family RNA polymerase sigma factor [Candidatus Hydrogenedentes bacterium]|nr:sigma-70 family RNA polymerase sigma factor [Candidatus Hydrogenedentota bacterium]
MSMVDSTSDETLMEQLGGGDDDALAELVRRYQQDVFRFCLHYLKNVEVAREMAQETFLRVYAARDRFDVSKRFKPWMLCIARNLCLNEIKRKKTVQMETLEEYASSSRGESGEVLRSTADGPSEILQAAERRTALLQALEGLPEESREIVKLRYFEKLSAREIADIVESTEGAIRTRLHRILKQLREVFEPQRADL